MPTPEEFDPVGEFADALGSAPADERVYRVALQLHEPTRVSAVAERADCATDTARRHLDRLVDIGVLDRVTDSPATYRRNESYFEWRARNRLERLSTSELQERVEQLAERERTFRERYGSEQPGDVDALDHADGDIEDVWLDLSEWETVRQRLQRLEAIRQRRANDSEREAA